MCFKKITKLLRGEKPSPGDWVLRDAITLMEGEDVCVLVDLSRLGLSQKPKVWIPSIPDTNSMDPTFDMGHNNILIAGKTPEDHLKLLDKLQVGDIAVYRALSLIIHRVYKIDFDDEGRYFKFKGDNIDKVDSYKLRDRHIEWISIGTLY